MLHFKIITSFFSFSSRALLASHSTRQAVSIKENSNRQVCKIHAKCLMEFVPWRQFYRPDGLILIDHMYFFLALWQNNKIQVKLIRRTEIS